jgi:hypothetical protein
MPDVKGSSYNTPKEKLMLRQTLTAPPRILFRKVTPILAAIARFLAFLWGNPWRAAILALTVYTFIGVGAFTMTTTEAPLIYAHLADAFAHGSLALRSPETITANLLSYEGSAYAAQGPLPALLLVPLVLLTGPNGSAVLFGALLGALNVSLTGMVLQAARDAGVLRLNRWRYGLLILFFALGTVQLMAASYGKSIILEILVAYSAVAAGYLAALRLQGWRAFLALGLAAAAAILTRWPAVIALLWPLGWLWINERRLGRQAGLGTLLVVICILAAFGGIGWYNWARFGAPLEFGLQYSTDPNIAAYYQQHGIYGLSALPQNLLTQLLGHPLLSISQSKGFGLLLMSPLIVVALFALKERDLHVRLLFATITLAAIPLLLRNSLGSEVAWLSTFDLLLPLLMVIAIGQRRLNIGVMSSLVLFSMVQHLVLAFTSG